MIVLVGLGNFGKKYSNTRHNVGFMFLNYLADKQRTPFIYNKYFNAEIARTTILNQDVFFLKPHTFMNLSGQSVQGIMSYFHVPTDMVWVIHDDIDLEIGKIRVRTEGSSGGHKGMQSVIESLSTNKIVRFKMGIKTDSANQIPTENFVLQKFLINERKIIEESIEKTTELLKEALKEGVKNISC